MKNMKNLYKGLSQLDKEERSFLADKYHHKDGRRTDKQVSAQYGISEKEYRKERVAIERKLHEMVQALHKGEEQWR